MNRRQFLQAAATTGAAVGFGTPSLAMKDGLAAGARLVVDGLDTSVMSEGFLKLLRTGGVHCVHQSMGGLDSYGTLFGFLDAHRGEIVRATTVRGIREAREQGQLSVVLGVQDANLLEKMLVKEPTQGYGTVVAGLRAYYELGLRTHGICYNVANVFGGGCMDPEVPLTQAGRRLVEEIHKSRIVLDVGGHTGERTSLDAIALSSGVPVVCTHTNVRTLNPNIRAVSDRVMEAIAGTGGVLGISAISDFLVRNPVSAKQHGRRSPRAQLPVYLDQLDYVRKRVGADHVALGPDFVWGWGESYDHKPEDSMTFPPEALSAGPAVTVEGFANISELPNVTAGLKARGWSESDLDKFLGGNWLRVYERVWGA